MYQKHRLSEALLNMAANPTPSTLNALRLNIEQTKNVAVREAILKTESAMSKTVTKS